MLFFTLLFNPSRTGSGDFVPPPDIFRHNFLERAQKFLAFHVIEALCVYNKIKPSTQLLLACSAHRRGAKVKKVIQCEACSKGVVPEDEQSD